MKKKTFCLAMAAVMAFGLAGCGGAETKGEAATTVESTADTTAADTTAADTAADTSAAESETSAEAQAAGGHFIVGFDQEFPPMGFMGDNGEYTVFDKDGFAKTSNTLWAIEEFRNYVANHIYPRTKTSVKNLEAMARSFTEKMEEFASMNRQNSSIFTAAKIVGENIQDLLYAME